MTPAIDDAVGPQVSVVILTRGDRTLPLRDAIASVDRQRSVRSEIIVVANGVSADQLGVEFCPNVTIVESPENVGVPAGRNLGVGSAAAPFVAFLDDDATLIDEAVLERAIDRFAADPSLAVVALRIVDGEGATAPRHVPRVGARDPERAGYVTGFLGGASLVRATAFRAAGGYAHEFFYAMEETDLALRLADRGWTIWYDGRPSVFHPRTQPSRHPHAVRTTMRNRVWLAHRSLPAPLAILYVVNWLGITLARQPREALTLVGALGDAWRSRPGPRRPIAWRTVVRLTRLGRPPVI